MAVRPKVKARRQELELSQLEVAQRCGISQTHLSQIETGKRKPSFNTMRKISLTLNSDVSVLFFADDCC